ncbi:hypothetical protein C8R44DRAFT_881290 [Mycena epipterygia]|nr:hypothetical protein C8R44DRAFT_881290 [Mycena epipterygia]
MGSGEQLSSSGKEEFTITSSFGPTKINRRPQSWQYISRRHATFTGVPRLSGASHSLTRFMGLVLRTSRPHPLEWGERVQGTGRAQGAAARVALGPIPVSEDQSHWSMHPPPVKRGPRASASLSLPKSC